MFSYLKIIIWGVVWMLVWLLSSPFRGKRDNCLTWAMTQFDDRGGYLVIRWCRSNKMPWIKWPHFMWLEAEHHVHLRHIVPSDDNRRKKHYLPTPWFDPKEIKGDGEDKEN